MPQRSGHDPAGAQSSPSFVAAYTASARRDTISLRIRLPTWNFTVVSEMNSSAADRPVGQPPREQPQHVELALGEPLPLRHAAPDSERTIAEALRASNALSPRDTARIARTSSVVSTSLTT